MIQGPSATMHRPSLISPDKPPRLQSAQRLVLLLFCYISCVSPTIPQKTTTLPQGAGRSKGLPSETAESRLLGNIDALIASPDLTSSNVRRILNIPLGNCYSQKTDYRFDVYRGAATVDYDIEHHEFGSTVANASSECTSIGIVGLRIHAETVCISLERTLNYYGKDFEIEPGTPHSNLGDSYVYKRPWGTIYFRFTRDVKNCLGHVLIGKKCYKGPDKPSCEPTLVDR